MASTTQANGTDRIIHLLDLDEYGLKDVPAENKEAAKKEVAAYLLNEALRDMSNSTSPVQGEGRFRVLDSDYAEREKSGVRLSDLELEGDLKDSLISESAIGSFIRFGHTGGQVPKSDGHNQLSAKAKSWARTIGFPKRRYIPDDGQKFTSKYTNTFRSIIENFRGPTQTEDFELELDDFDEGATRPATTVVNTDLFSDDVLDNLFEEAQRRRGN